MKIAHVVWGMETGGVETMLVNIINEQVKTETVRLFIINDFVEETIVNKISPKCIIKRLNRKHGSRNPLKILHLNLWIWKYRPDIIHVHSYKVSTLIFGKSPIVRTIHNTGNIPEEYPKMKALYAISYAVKDYTAHQGFSSIVIENGIDAESFEKRPPIPSHDNTYHLVQVSRLDIAQKGQDILINALGKLVHEKNIKNFVMHFIGTGDSEEELKAQVEHLNLTNHIVFEGFKNQDYLRKNLCKYDLFIQPSRYEGFGLTVAEAMAAKVPVLVSNIEGPMEIIGNGKVGMPFHSEDVEDLANKLETVLKGGYDMNMLDKAYTRVCEHYHVKQTARKYVEEYKKVALN